MLSISTLFPQIERDVLQLSIRGVMASPSPDRQRAKFQRLFGNTTPNRSRLRGSVRTDRYARPDSRFRDRRSRPLGPPADDGDAHVFLPIDSMLTNLVETNPRRELRYRK
jgi:hypothetical protein